MLLGRSNNRGARGQSSSRSRGSRGRGATSRGASAAGSSKHQNSNSFQVSFPEVRRFLKPGLVPKVLEVKNHRHRGSYHGTYMGEYFISDYRNNHSNSNIGPASSANPADSFERERLENAAKREQRGQNGIMVNGRGSRGGTPRGGISSKQVRFSDSAVVQNNPGLSSKDSQPTSSNPFGTSIPAPSNPFAASKPSSSPFNAATAATPHNPFAPAKAPVSANSFGTSTSPFNPFGKTVNQSSSISSFGTSPTFGTPSMATNINQPDSNTNLAPRTHSPFPQKTVQPVRRPSSIRAVQ